MDVAEKIAQKYFNRGANQNRCMAAIREATKQFQRICDECARSHKDLLAMNKTLMEENAALADHLENIRMGNATAKELLHDQTKGE
jgi:hypothetical protein